MGLQRWWFYLLSFLLLWLPFYCDCDAAAMGVFIVVISVIFLDIASYGMDVIVIIIFWCYHHLHLLNEYYLADHCCYIFNFNFFSPFFVLFPFYLFGVFSFSFSFVSSFFYPAALSHSLPYPSPFLLCFLHCLIAPSFCLSPPSLSPPFFLCLYLLSLYLVCFLRPLFFPRLSPTLPFSTILLSFFSFYHVFPICLLGLPPSFIYIFLTRSFSCFVFAFIHFSLYHIPVF